jgi:NADH:ubiquinone oxidoreductase subunit F (NADH-binding)
MIAVHRVLDPAPVESVTAHLAQGGGRGLRAALELGPATTIERLEASGLRGRGGGGFPTGTKWRTVAGFTTPERRATVVVNGAEGEPGSLKDRTLLLRNPYRVLEGALIAARTVDAHRVIVAVKASFVDEQARLGAAIAELEREGWTDGLSVEVLAGPEEYLYGEETALLEVVEGRAPLPRVAPPYRHGAEELGAGDRSAAEVRMADETTSGAAPTLANNVETMAHVAQILAHGPDWFREHGTAESPGTIVCTVSGWVQRAGVAEYPMGTPLRAVIEELGGGVGVGRIKAVLSGVANPFVPEARLDTPLTYEEMRAAGSGLGAAGFMVFDESVDLVAVAQGVSRFLAVESCGQCEPCKYDGLRIAELLSGFCASNGTDHDVDELSRRLDTVIDEARCNLAHQQQAVVNSLLAEFPEELARHLETAPDRAEAVTPVLVAPMVGIRDGRAVLDDRHPDKQPDWTYDAVDSGQPPAARLG